MNKFTLDFKDAEEYFVDQISSGHILSVKILEKIKFSQGFFFAYLPESVDKKKLHNFTLGGILPPIGRIDHPKFSNFWPTPIVDKELSEFICNFLREDTTRIAFFEDALRRRFDPHIHDIDCHIGFFDDQVYYWVTAKDSCEVILQSIKFVNNIWHSLIVLSIYEKQFDLDLNDRDFDIISENTKYIIAGAYDREGYIIWERTVE